MDKVKKAVTVPAKITTSFVIVITLVLGCGQRLLFVTNEPQHDKINKITCAPSEDSDQPGHPPSLIRVFAVRSMGS